MLFCRWYNCSFHSNILDSYARCVHKHHVLLAKPLAQINQPIFFPRRIMRWPQRWLHPRRRHSCPCVPRPRRGPRRTPVAREGRIRTSAHRVPAFPLSTASPEPKTPRRRARPFLPVRAGPSDSNACSHRSQSSSTSSSICSQEKWLETKLLLNSPPPIKIATPLIDKCLLHQLANESELGVAVFWRQSQLLERVPDGR